MATLDEINLFDRYLQAKNLQQDQRQEVADTIAPTPAQSAYIASFMAPGSSIPDVAGKKILGKEIILMPACRAWVWQETQLTAFHWLDRL